MELRVVKVSPYRTNCYVLVKENMALVIDPGDEYEKIKACIGDDTVIGALVTHGHIDHVGATKYFNDVYNYSNLKEGKYKIGPFKFEVIYVPGHTDDSIAYYFYEDDKMFTGDFLFKGTVGRTDLSTGSLTDMKNSLNKIKKYPDTKIYPGHGDFSSLYYEIENNIYFCDL